MATIPSGSIQQSRFIGTPIMVPVQAASPAGNVTFHRVRLKVTVGDGGGAIAQNDAEFEFSTPVSNGEVVWFDISSAFRAFADAYSPTPTAYVYPHLAANLNACDDYMIDGVSYEDMSPSATVQVTGKYLGALTDRERGAGISNQWSEPARYSRKPTSSPEIVYAGKTILRPVSTGTNPPGVDAIVVSTEGVDPAYDCYAISQPPHGHEIRFINSLGVHENIFVAGLPTRVVNITTDQYTIARQETITKFSRAIAVKYGDRETWTFSSGPLDEEWVSWYIHEFLMASWVWIDINDMWIPCHVLPEEQVTLVQHDKTDMLEVILALKLDINGSPL